MPTGFALEEASSIEVIAAYSAPHTVVPAVASSPGWHVLGEFYLPKSVAKARLDALFMVSSDSLTCRVRLFDMTAKAEVSGSRAQSQTTSPKRILSGVVALTGGRNFQIQAECTGGSGAGLFATVETATITD
jgi:hypothetical protein